MIFNILYMLGVWNRKTLVKVGLGAWTSCNRGQTWACRLYVDDFFLFVFVCCTGHAEVLSTGFKEMAGHFDLFPVLAGNQQQQQAATTTTTNQTINNHQTIKQSTTINKQSNNQQTNHNSNNNKSNTQQSNNQTTNNQTLSNNKYHNQNDQT